MRDIHTAFESCAACEAAGRPARKRYGFRWMFVAALLSPDYNSLVSKEVPISIRGTAFGLVSTTLGISIASGAVYRRVDVGQVRAQGSVRVAAIGQPGHGCNVLV